MDTWGDEFGLAVEGFALKWNFCRLYEVLIGFVVFWIFLIQWQWRDANITWRKFLDTQFLRLEPNALVSS